MSATAVGPDPKTEPVGVKLEQTAPGRYVGTFDGKDAGSYFISLVPGPGQAPILTGVDVPYSAEFRDRTTDEALLTTLASLAPKGGRPGRLIDAPPAVEDELTALLATNTFRHDLPKATSSQDAWFILAMIAACLFFADVLFRRVTIDVGDWAARAIAPVVNFVLRREAQPAPVEYMARLRNRKAEVTERIEQQRAAARFEPAPDARPSTISLEEQLGAAATAPPRPTPAAGLTPEKEEESYTSRLLKAKKQVWEGRKEK
jgi:hypothetical protein